jgi:hypothetical protein
VTETHPSPSGAILKERVSKRSAGDSSIDHNKSVSGGSGRRRRKSIGGTKALLEAHEHLTTATTMYREMDMRFWLEQAEAEAAAG